jgi:hypothetical protein
MFAIFGGFWGFLFFAISIQLLMAPSKEVKELQREVELLKAQKKLDDRHLID